jgi:hypothetical protein
MHSSLKRSTDAKRFTDMQIKPAAGKEFAEMSRWDRVFWVFLRRARFWWTEVLVAVKPEIIVRWHRAGFRLYWRFLSRQEREEQTPDMVRAAYSCQIFSPSATDWCKAVEPVLDRMLTRNCAFFSTGFSTELLKSFLSRSALRELTLSSRE